MLNLLFAIALATKPECKATTDIEEFQTQIQRACGEHIQSVSLTGNHERARFVITFAVDLHEQQIAETYFAPQAWHVAVTSHTILNRVYPMKRFEYSMKDANGKDVCDFVFEGEEEKPVSATCVDGVR